MEIRANWFGLPHPINAKGGSTTIGTGVDGTVTITSDAVGTVEGNAYTAAVVAGSGNDVAMTATLTGTNILVTLGTDGGGALDAAKNTAILIGAAIDALTGIIAGHSGTGATAVGITSQKATAIVGDAEVANGFITVTRDTPGVAGNAFTIVVEDGVAQNAAMAVALDGSVITITLGMSDIVEFIPDDLKNTAELIAAQIDFIAGFTATHDGTGAEVPDIADGDIIAFSGGTTGILGFTGGQYGTECPEPFVVVRDGADYYVNTAPNGRYEANWFRFNLVSF